ncbi:MAG: aspartate aminotransferase family protein [Planctomycetota bacterium]
MKDAEPAFVGPEKSSDRSEGDVNYSNRRAQWQSKHLGERSKNLLEEDARCFLHQSLSTPCLNGMARCEGIYIEDLEGRRYMDFHGNYVHQVGFGHPEVIAAVKEQLDTLSFCTRRYTNPVAVELAKKLTQLAPGDLNRVLFAPGGTSAIGMALKLARLATGRFKTISMWDSFHGASLDSISVGGEEIFRGSIGPLLPGTEHVPPPDSYRCLWDCHERGGCDLKCANYIEYVLEKERDVAAVLAEPVRSTPYVPTPDYWQRVRKACDKHGTLLIFDEIPHALGRTGKMFTCENFGVVPDMLVLGKGLGGGIFPWAALVAREGLNIAADRALGHYTHEKNPVACAAALATIRVIERDRLVERSRLLGERSMTRLKRMMDRYPIIGNIRGLGLLLGIELVKDRGTREPAVDAAEAVMYAALSRGLSFKLTMGSILTLAPPLIISEAELDRAFDILEDCIREVSP